MSYPYEIPAADGPRHRFGLWAILIAFLVLLFSAHGIANYVIDYNWWREMGQVDTWLSLLAYKVAPFVAAAGIVFVVLFFAHARAVKLGGITLGLYRWYARISTLALFVIALLIAGAVVDTWTVVRYFGGLRLPVQAAAWHDPVFNNPLKFYLFDLPFYNLLLQFVLVLVVVTAILYWVTARLWQLRDLFDTARGVELNLDARTFFKGALESRFLRGLTGVFLLALAARLYLGRYDMLWNDHGFMVGIDWLDQNVTLPLQWVLIVSCAVSAALVFFGRWKALLIVVAAFLVKVIVPAVVSATYVGPNEISIEKPFIARHIQATRAAFGLGQRLKELDFRARMESRFDPARNQAILSNVRLWDWQAFHDTVTQIQALRPYYRFADTDVDRYMIDGQLRQTLLTPRELDINLLPEQARSRWPNTHFVYTHGYGSVLAEANRITPDGLPVLFIQDAPPVVKTSSLKLTRPELYFSEVQHEPVFVHTAQPEFNYPSGEDNVFSRYAGKGGFPVSSFGMRLAATVSEGDPNILLTSYLTGDSRMMIHRTIRDRVQTLAGFISWDSDPYLVITKDGHQVWMIDGYTTSDAHPYSRSVSVSGIGDINYIRNAVKATIDAYDGDIHIYVFDPSDPIISAYERLFPHLFQPFSEMPADLRAHARYPETLFRVQAETYRTFHMRDPQAFYNREDVWDIAGTSRGAEGGRARPMSPTYVVASLPGEDTAEFLLLLPFTPRNKDNMIGLMVARCDGQHLGEMVVLQLSKQELIYGPMQIEARINQEQTISKDLTLWSQQGSTVLRGQVLVLPIADTFLYVEPLYIQSSVAQMPQLKKIVLAMGNLLIYTDTWDEAVTQLTAFMQREAPLPAAPVVATPRKGLPAAAQPAQPAAPAPMGPSPAERQLQSIRQHLQRYRDLAAQGKWAEAGKELDAIQQEVSRR